MTPDEAEYIKRANQRRESFERLATWVALSESVVLQLIRSGNDYATSDWLDGPASAALQLLLGWIEQQTGNKDIPYGPEAIGFLDDEIAADSHSGKRMVARAKRAVPIASRYQMAFWADRESELRGDFAVVWRQLDEWMEADLGRTTATSPAGTSTSESFGEVDAQATGSSDR